MFSRVSCAEKPKRETKRVYRVKGGLVSLLHTPAELVATVEVNSVQSPLLRLPAEIRNKIFKMALGGTCIAISPNSNRWNYKKICEVFNGDRPVSWDFKFALPRVCRQIYHETATLVYSENIFSFGYEPHSVYFIDDRKQVQREAITTVEVYRGLLSRLGDIGSVLCTFKSLFNVRKVYVKRADRLFFS